MTAVWVARPKKDADRTAPRVLIAAKGAQSGQALADLLSQFTWPASTTFTMLSVQPSLFAGQVPEWLQQQARSPDIEEMVRHWAEQQEREMVEAETNLKNLIRRLPSPLNACAVKLAQGDPTPQILDAIGHEPYDLVVLGARHKRSLLDTFLGGTAEAVLSHASCSVLVVPQKESP